MCRTIITNFDLYDVAALTSNNPGHTYFRHRREMTSARYDRIYTTSSLLPGISFKMLRRTSDHAPLEVCTAKNGNSKRWRMSDYLLSNAFFLEGLHNTMRETLQGFSNCPSSLPLHLIQYNIDFNTLVGVALFTVSRTTQRPHNYNHTSNDYIFRFYTKVETNNPKNAGHKQIQTRRTVLKTGEI